MHSPLKYIIAILLFAQPLLALIDMNNGCYSNNWVDLEVPGAKLRVLRAYKSRSLFNGMFGFGWCSEYETRLNQTPEGGVKVSECGDGEEVYYSAREVSRADKEAVIKRIFENMKKSGNDPGFSADYLANLKKQLMRDQTARENYAAQYKVTIPVKAGSLLLANGHETESVLLQKDFYTRTLPDGSIERFDLGGRLIGLFNKNGELLKINYALERIASVENGKGAKLLYQYFSNGKVQKVAGPGGLKSEYRYDGDDNLVWVKNADDRSGSEPQTYDYNEFHNLTKATFPDKTFISIKYDNQKDLVIGFTDAQKCSESYKYETSAANPELNYWTTATKTCDGVTVVKGNRYEYWHKQLPAGQTVLQRIQTTINGVVKDVVYDDATGKPLSIKNGKDTAEYRYLPNGLLKSKITPQKTLDFSYDNKVLKISKVIEKTFAESKKPIIKVSSFRYDSRGNLVFAENSEGQKVKLTYDNMGRIVSLVDGQNQVVSLKYEDRYGKPSEISRKNLGTMKISYGSKGEISAVESREGPLVAESINESYNNLILLLDPASQDIY